MEIEKGTAQVVADLVKANVNMQYISVTHPVDKTEAPLLIIPGAEGMSVRAVDSLFDPYRQRPMHRTGTAVMRDVRSFVDHVNRFKTAESALFADNSKTKPGIRAVLDYHERVNVGESVGLDANASFMRHKTQYDFPLSDEWKAWVSTNGQFMEQESFASMVEERNEDIMPNPPSFHGELTAQDQRLADLVEDLSGESIAVSSKRIAGRRTMMGLSRGLSITATLKLANATNLNNSTGKLIYEEEQQTHDSTGTAIEVPFLFLLAIPVFENGSPYRIVARLRYKRNGPKVMWRYDLYRQDKVLQHACNEVWSEVSKATGLPLFVGNPEA